MSINIDHAAWLAVVTSLWNAINWNGVLAVTLNMVCGFIILKLVANTPALETGDE
jgi:hypothetical protein